MPGVVESRAGRGHSRPGRFRGPRLALTLLALLLLGTTGSGLQARFPALLDKYLEHTARLSPAEREQLMAGQPVTRLLDADESKEVAVLGAVWIASPIHRYVEAIKDIENMEKGGGFKVTKRISATPTIRDFDGLRIPDEDLVDLRTCQVGNCAVKLSAQALRRFQTERPGPAQFLLGGQQIAALQVQLAEHQAQVGVVGHLLQRPLQLGNREARVALLHECPSVLCALLHRNLIAGGERDQAEQQAGAKRSQARPSSANRDRAAPAGQPPGQLAAKPP